MFLKKLSLVNFKNIHSQTIDFTSRIVCFTGENGKGKTNLLDAVYHMAFLKSYFHPVAQNSIKHGEEFYMVEGTFDIDGDEESVLCSFKKGHKKVSKRNGKAYEKLADHIGLIPLVIISPSDRDLIVGGSELRRKFIDGVISQSDRTYLSNILQYQKVLSQRNALLKYFAQNRTFNRDNLEVYNQQLISYGKPIFEKRKEFIEEFIPIFNERYKHVSNGAEEVSVSYKSELYNHTFEELLQESLAKDKMLQYTSEGIHKDDIIFQIENHPIKKFGSQGQQKSFLIALKLSQYDLLKKKSHKKPILLLDDVFDKLDEGRVSQLISLVNHNDFGQLFISDTHKERTEEVIKSIHESYQIIEL